MRWSCWLAVQSVEYTLKALFKMVAVDLFFSEGKSARSCSSSRLCMCVLHIFR